MCLIALYSFYFILFICYTHLCICSHLSFMCAYVVTTDFPLLGINKRLFCPADDIVCLTRVDVFWFCAQVAAGVQVRLHQPVVPAGRQDLSQRRRHHLSGRI